MDGNGLPVTEPVTRAHPCGASAILPPFINNEIGVIQDITAIGNICRENKVIFHLATVLLFNFFAIHSDYDVYRLLIK